MREKRSAAARSSDESGSSERGSASGGDAGGSGVPNAGDHIETVIDEDTFSQFEAALGDRAAIDAVLRMYLDDLPKFIAQLRQAVDEGRREDARAAVHRLKGNAGMIGALRLADACRRFEAAAHDDVPDLGALAGVVIDESDLAAGAVRFRLTRAE